MIVMSMGVAVASLITFTALAGMVVAMVWLYLDRPT